MVLIRSVVPANTASCSGRAGGETVVEKAERLARSGSGSWNR